MISSKRINKAKHNQLIKIIHFSFKKINSKTLNYNSNSASKKEIRKYLWPMIFNEETKNIFYKSMILLVISKSLAIANPFFLKIAVNAISEASKMDINLALLSLFGFGFTKFLSTTFHELRLNQIVELI